MRVRVLRQLIEAYLSSLSSDVDMAGKAKARFASTQLDFVVLSDSNA